MTSPDAGDAPDSRRSGFLKRFVRARFDRRERAIAASPLPAEEALSAAARIGALRAALSRRWPEPAQVRSLFGVRGLSSSTLAARIGALEARNRLVIRRLEGRPLDPFAPLVSWTPPTAAEGIPRPAILVTAHLGAIYLLAAALNRLNVPRLAIRWSEWHTPGHLERSASTAVGPERRTEVLRTAVATLRDGGFVTTVLDGAHGSTVPARILDRDFRLSQGAFTLARLSGAPVIPIAALWEGDRIRAAVWPAVATPAEAARWLEELLRSRPEQCSLGLLRRLLFDPAVGQPVEH
ncbi:MAG: hypothetical protein AB7G12_07650 [Thermoanaerobaculia bacterium]